MICSAEQLNMLFKYLEKHKDLARGQLRSADGRKKAKRLWQEITDILNASGGCVKTVPQWQKVWTDRKHLAKKNAVVNSTAAASGGEGCPPLGSWEMKVLSIMGEGFGVPDTSPRVPVATVDIKDEDDSSSTSSEQKAGPSSVSQEAKKYPVSRNRVRVPPRCRRRDPNNSNISNRLLRIEGAKIDMLKSIRDSIQDLTAVVKELVELKRSSLLEE